MISVLVRLCGRFLSNLSLSSALLHHGTRAFLSYFLFVSCSCLYIPRANNGEKARRVRKFFCKLEGKEKTRTAHPLICYYMIQTTKNLIHKNPSATPTNAHKVNGIFSFESFMNQ
jgi:hypothetical protein